MGSTSTPKLGLDLAAVKAPRVAEQGMAGEFLKAYLLMEEEFKLVCPFWFSDSERLATNEAPRTQLKTNTDRCQAFVKDLGQPNQLPGQAFSYSDRDWTMGDLEQLSALTEKARPGVGKLVEATLVRKRQVGELSSALLKGAY